MYDRESGDVAANNDGFEATHDILTDRKPVDGNSPYTVNMAGSPIRYTAERSEAFARWLLGTFTKQGDAVLDCFAGTGTLARASKSLQRHCVSVEKDEECFDTCIAPIVHVPSDVGQIKFQGQVSEFVKSTKEQQALSQQQNYPPPFHTPMSPTRSTGSSGPPGFSHDGSHRPVLHSFPQPFWPPRVDVGRPMPMYPPGTSMYGIPHQAPPQAQTYMPSPTIPPHGLPRYMPPPHTFPHQIPRRM